MNNPRDSVEKERSSMLENWAGTYLTPLPEESMFSNLSRFAWRNVLTLQSLERNFSLNFSGDSYGTARLFVANLSDFTIATGWNSVPDIERSVGLPGAASTWTYSSFRFCPICLGHLYHSTWHQFVLLNHCPIHGCPLHTECLSCFQSTEGVGFNNASLHNPYCCPKCNKPLSGKKISVHLREEFASKLDDIKKSFFSYMTWMSDAKRGINFVELVRRKSARCEGWNMWCEPHEFLRAIVLNIYPPPVELATSVPLRAIVLAWEEQTSNFNTVDCGSRRYNNWHMRNNAAQTAYKLVVGGITRWVAGVTSDLDREWAIAMQLRHAFDRAQIEVRGVAPEVLALVVMRACFEPYSIFGLWDDPAIYDVSHSGISFLSDLDPVAGAAYFLGFYCVALYSIQRAIRLGASSIALPERAGDVVPTYEWGEVRKRGIVAFPNVSKFPVSRAAAWLKLKVASAAFIVSEV